MKTVLVTGSEGQLAKHIFEESKEEKRRLSSSKSFWRSMTPKSMKSASDGNEDESKKDSEKI